MAKYEVKTTLTLELDRGPEPTPEEVHEAVSRRLGNDPSYVAHVADDGEGGFGSAHLTLIGGPMTARRLDDGDD